MFRPQARCKPRHLDSNICNIRYLSMCIVMFSYHKLFKFLSHIHTYLYGDTEMCVWYSRPSWAPISHSHPMHFSRRTWATNTLGVCCEKQEDIYIYTHTSKHGKRSAQILYIHIHAHVHTHLDSLPICLASITLNSISITQVNHLGDR